MPKAFTSLASTARTKRRTAIDRKSTRLNSSHGYISYAVFCLKKKKKKKIRTKEKKKKKKKNKKKNNKKKKSKQDAKHQNENKDESLTKYSKKIISNRTDNVNT